jgi:hypothetical protein
MDFPSLRQVGQVQPLYYSYDGGPKGGLLVAGAWDDVGPAHAGQVDGIDRERIGDPRDDQLEVVELRPHDVQQRQGRTASGPQVAHPAVRELNVADLAVRTPGLGVPAGRRPQP